MSPYREQVAAALQAVTIRGPTRYAWLGRASRSVPVSLDDALDKAGRRRYLVACLREELYVSFYCHGRPVAARWGEPQPVAPDPGFAAALSRANSGRGSWEPGWSVERVAGEQVVVGSSRLRARIARSACRVRAGVIRPGAAVSVRLPKELPEVSPGFHTVIGEAPSAGSPASVVRVYWNVGATGAPALVSALTARLNRAQVPFRLKVADHPFRLDRCDAAVLYLPGPHFDAVGGTLREVADALGTYLRPAVPAFTLALADGVGLAEENGGGESFGERRCALLADGIVRCHEQAIVESGARLAAIAARFAEDGVRIDAPYLEPSLAGRHVLV
jgi:hypothetical protein